MAQKGGGLYLRMMMMSTATRHQYPTNIIINAKVSEGMIWMYVCLLLFHEKTTRRIWMKFGTEIDYSLE